MADNIVLSGQQAAALENDHLLYVCNDERFVVGYQLHIKHETNGKSYDVEVKQIYEVNAANHQSFNFDSDLKQNLFRRTIAIHRYQNITIVEFEILKTYYAFSKCKNYTLARKSLTKVPILDMEYKNIYYFNLRNNLLKELPNTLVINLINIVKIDLSHNNLVNLPNFKNSHSLQYINISHNRLTKFPAHLPLFLKELNLSHNFITFFPIDKFYPCLKTLNLSSNLFPNLEDAHDKLPVIERLYVDKNPLKALPYWLGNLTSLREFNLDVNGHFWWLNPKRKIDLSKLKKLEVVNTNRYVAKFDSANHPCLKINNFY